MTGPGPPKSSSEGPEPRPPGKAREQKVALPDSKVTVTVDDAHLGDVDSLAARLRAAGMNVEQVLGGVGIITGSVPAHQRRSIGGIAGVAAVEDETPFQLPPPDAEIQ